MKVLVVLALAALANARSFNDDSQRISAYGYIQDVAIPLGEAIRKAEARAPQSVRIVGGSIAQPEQFPWQAGLLSSFQGLAGTGVCGGSLISSNKVVTAAHCWFDGINQAFSLTVVLGSVTLFSGGTRIETSNVFMHPNWFPLLVRNDVAVIYLPNPVTADNAISPIALPSGSQLDENFAGERATASGFGRTADDVSGGLTLSQVLSFVDLNIITNNVCFLSYPLNLHSSNICTSGAGGSGTCQGDSGGPLVVNRNNSPVLVGVTSFGSRQGCQAGVPAAFARVTSFMDFFNEHL